jgi:acyl carrier protein
MTLEKFPLNRNGKLDRKVLAQLKSDAKAEGAERADESEEKTPAEEMLAGIWSQVLGRERVGAADNFFELGGHSLLATQVMSRVREVFKTELPLRSIFEASTLRDLARRLEEQRARSLSLLSPPMISVPKNGGLPLSFAQQRLWFIHQLFPDSAAYHVPAAIRLEGLLNVQAIRRSLAEIIRRHEVLRTTFKVVEDEPVQVIDPQPKLVMPVVDLSGLCEQAREAEANRIATAEARRGFDLEHGPLLRLNLLRLAEQSSLLVMSMHHIVSDGWSTSLFVRELQVLYDAFSSGRSSPLAELPVQYADFSVWQRGWLRGEVLDEQLAYWRTQLEGAPATLSMPTKQPRGTTTSNEGATFAVEVSKDVTEATREFCRREGVTFFMMLFTAFNVLLSRFSGQRDLLVGTNIANRNRIETESMIGFFVNMLVLRTRLSEDQSFRQLLGQVRNTTLDAYAHQDVPFEKIVEELRPERDLSRSPFFQVVFTLQNTPPRALKLSGLDITGVLIDLGATTYDLIFNMRDTGQGLIASMTYNKNLFDASLIDRMVGSAETLLSSVIANPDLSLSELEVILRESDARRIAARERHFAEARKRKLQSVKRRTIEAARLT